METTQSRIKIHESADVQREGDAKTIDNKNSLRSMGAFYWPMNGNSSSERSP